MHAREHSLSPNPLLDDRQIHAVLRRHWSLDGRLTDLGSLQDQNVRVGSAEGSFVLKVVPDSADVEQVALQNAAMQHVAERGHGVTTPRPVRSDDGEDIVSADGVHCRLLTWVPGHAYAERPWLRISELPTLGALGARTAAALADFDHPGLDHALLWDARRSARVIDDLDAHLPHGDLRDQVRRAVQPLDALDPQLPLFAIHGDVTPSNVVHAADADVAQAVVLDGILDFGDVMRTWRLADVAAAVVGVVEHPGRIDPLEAALALLAGYHDVTPLTADEAEALWPMVLARAAVNAAVSCVQSTNNPANWYAVDGAGSSLRALAAVAAVPLSLAAAGARATLGHARPVAVPARTADLLTGLSTARVLDLSADTDLVRDDAWSADTVVLDVPGERTVDAPAVAVVRWGEHRIDRAGELSTADPHNLQLGVEVHAAPATPVRLPVLGTPVAAPQADAGSLILSVSDGLYLQLTGLAPDPNEIEPGAVLAAGTTLGVTVADRPLCVRLTRDPDLPPAGTPRNRAAWLEACPDPTPLLGIDVAAPAPPDPLVRRRERESVVAAPQHLYYDRPVEMVRGRRQYLYSSHGRGYLDMINNIAAVGHAHPNVTRAATRQFRRLNTNSRFLYASMTRYSERLAQLLPPQLDRIFLVNSGSEAADLALQLARRFTGRDDVAAIDGAYHGWTGAVLALSSSPQDRPNWRAEIQLGNHVVAAPSPYRGVLGPDVDAYVAAVGAACEAAAPAGGLAAFVCEPLLGNQGAVEPFPGYLARAYAQVRSAGGLCLADEVQVGMARTGDFWAFEHDQVVPDIVFTAKAAGNGHPVGIVACRREIADAFDRDAAFFASTGGGPVSCEVGLAVLDAIRDEGLQDNARDVGGYLRTRLVDLAATEPLIGAVHGRGLYLGVELVRDRDDKEPATAEAAAIGERLLDRGVIAQPTGDAGNVLKVKPPLCLDRRGADFFVDQLTVVLDELRNGSR